MHPCFGVSGCTRSNQVHSFLFIRLNFFPLVFHQLFAVGAVGAVLPFLFFGMILLSYSYCMAFSFSSIYLRLNSHVFFIVTLPFPLLQQHNIVCGLLSGTWFGFLSGVWEGAVLPAVWSIGFSQNSSTHECMQYVNDVNRYAISPLVDARSSHLQFVVAIIYFIPIVTVETARM